MPTGFTAAELRQLKLSDSIDAAHDRAQGSGVVPLTAAQRDRVREMRALGLGINRIASLMKVNTRRLRREMPQ